MPHKKTKYIKSRVKSMYHEALTKAYGKQKADSIFLQRTIDAPGFDVHTTRQLNYKLDRYLQQ